MELSMPDQSVDPVSAAAVSSVLVGILTFLGTKGATRATSTQAIYTAINQGFEKLVRGLERRIEDLEERLDDCTDQHVKDEKRIATLETALLAKLTRQMEIGDD